MPSACCISTQATAAEYEALDHAHKRHRRRCILAAHQQAFRAAGGGVYRDVKYLVPIRKDLQDIAAELAIAGAALGDGDQCCRSCNSPAIRRAQPMRRKGILRPIRTFPWVDRTRPAKRRLVKAGNSLDALIKLAPAAARRHVTVAAAGVHDRLLWTCLWLVVTLGISSFIHMRLGTAHWCGRCSGCDDMRLKSAMREHNQIVPRVDGEFREIAAYFNGLARELAELYKSLEDKVIARSRELVRSERLASVGFLAAGVAHEINNPLSVISGYAELAEKNLQQVFASPGGGGAAEAEIAAEADALENALQAQTIIRDEAFRCKEITSRLLSLARGGGDGRELLSLAEVARQVGMLIKGLKNYRNRNVVIELSDGESLPVIANSTEMKQVLLNLTVNALEAVPDRGTVHIGGRSVGDSVELFIEDNGKGMTPDVLHQIFEPFFTAKRISSEPGTGLGLSITHAIIENHGGHIRAESDGPRKGEPLHRDSFLPRRRLCGMAMARTHLRRESNYAA